MSDNEPLMIAGSAGIIPRRWVKQWKRQQRAAESRQGRVQLPAASHLPARSQSRNLRLADPRRRCCGHRLKVGYQRWRHMLGAGAATYARDVTVPADIDIDIDTEAAKCLRRDKETTDFCGARGAPGVGVPTSGAANTDKINREKRKVVKQ